MVAVFKVLKKMILYLFDNGVPVFKGGGLQGVGYGQPLPLVQVL